MKNQYHHNNSQLHAVTDRQLALDTVSLRSWTHAIMKSAALSVLGILLSTSAYASLLDFETGYTIGDSGATLQSRNPAFIGTMPEAAIIYNSGLPGFGSFSMKIGQSSNTFLPIFSDNPANITLFTASVDIRPGSAYTDWSEIKFGSDGAVSWQTAHANGTPQQLSSLGFYFSGQGGANISQIQKIQYNLFGTIQNTGISYSSSLTYTISLSLDYLASQATLSLAQGGSTLFSQSASIVGTSFQNTKRVDTIISSGSGDFSGGGTIPTYDNFNTEAVPEPSTWALLMLAMATVVIMRRRQAT